MCLSVQSNKHVEFTLHIYLAEHSSSTLLKYTYWKEEYHNNEYIMKTLIVLKKVYALLLTSFLQVFTKFIIFYSQS